MTVKSPVHPGSTSAAATAVAKANTKTDTQPEVLVRSLLHRKGYRFRKNLYINFPSGSGKGVTPDIVFTKHKLAMFIDGCFWHVCPEHGMIPQSNVYYWKSKLEGNVERDRNTNQRLTSAGWTVARFWEHEDPESVVERIGTFLVDLNSTNT